MRALRPHILGAVALLTCLAWQELHGLERPVGRNGIAHGDVQKIVGEERDVRLGIAGYLIGNANEDHKIDKFGAIGFACSDFHGIFPDAPQQLLCVSITGKNDLGAESSHRDLLQFVFEIFDCLRVGSFVGGEMSPEIEFGSRCWCLAEIFYGDSCFQNHSFFQKLGTGNESSVFESEPCAATGNQRATANLVRLPGGGDRRFSFAGLSFGSPLKMDQLTFASLPQAFGGFGQDISEPCDDCGGDGRHKFGGVVTKRVPNKNDGVIYLLICLLYIFIPFGGDILDDWGYKLRNNNKHLIVARVAQWIGDSLRIGWLVLTIFLLGLAISRLA